MKKIPSDIISFLEKQGFVIVSTLDPGGTIHCAAKGLVAVEEKGKLYLIDLYRKTTFNNLQNNSTISITAVDEHEFIGYTLKGKAKIVEREKIKEEIIRNWEEGIIRRISSRVIKNIKRELKSLHHPESRFPHPEYLIEMEIREIVDLTPHHLKRSV
jgi:uncharacterized pyridoxamine 5'-phosphate oxidase family protein